MDAPKQPEAVDPGIQTWLQKISAYETTFKEWEGRTVKILERYKDDRNAVAGTSTSSRFNILWSNVQTLIPAVYARLPKPDVSRRFRDNDPVGRVAALMIERSLEFELDHYPDYRSAMKNSVFDRFLGGRGVSWVRYEPHFKAMEASPNDDGVQVTEDVDADDSGEAPAEEVDYECCPVDYVHWRDFGHVVARTWEEVPAVWRRVYMSRPALVERFGEDLGNKIPLDTKPKEENKQSQTSTENYQACIYEIWDKEKKEALWISKSLNQILDAKPDPLKLECFWPCPRPLFATITTDSLVPVPDFSLYQDQARELDSLCTKIDGLIIALQIRGIYDAAVPELARLFTEAGNTDLIAVKNWQSFAEKNGLKGAIDLVDIAPIASALVESYKAMDEVKNQVYEIMGIADIIRGATEAQETATAQKLKGQFGSLRLKAMQGDVIQYATELLQIKAQIICNQFQPETIIQISGVSQMSPEDQQLVPQALGLIKNGTLRDFRIEVSSDSMVQLDEAQEKSNRMEFLKAIGEFMTSAMPMAQQQPELLPMLVELLKFGVTGFKVGKSVEGAIDAAMDQLKQAAANPQQKPDPEMAKIQGDMQLKQQEMMMNAQFSEREHQFNMQLEQAKMQAARDKEMAQLQADMQVESAKAQFELQRERDKLAAMAQAEQLKLQAKAESDRQQMMYDMQLEQFKAEQKLQSEITLAHIKKDAAVEVAEINAQTVMTPEQDAAANTENE